MLITFLDGSCPLIIDLEEIEEILINDDTCDYRILYSVYGGGAY